jgi:O-antigen/teichoic acid export membrane protein
LTGAIPFLLLPILTRYLSPRDYGVMAMMTVLVGIASPFVGLNLYGAISVRYFETTQPQVARYVGNCLLLLLISTLCVSLVLWSFSQPISNLTAVPRYWLAAIVPAAGQFLILVVLVLYQVRQKALQYGAFQLLQTVLNIGLTLLFVVVLGFDWRGRIHAQIIAVLVCATIAVIILRRYRWVRFHYDRGDVRHALMFGVPLIPHVLGAMLITQTDRIFITNMVGVAEAGVYVVGVQVALVLEMLAGSFNKAFGPWLYERLARNEEADRHLIVKVTYAYCAGMLLLAAGLALVTPWLLSFFVGEAFEGASAFTPWLALGAAFTGMYYMVVHYIIVARKTHLLAIITFVTGLTNLLLNYVLISANGTVGAAQASALALLISFLLTWWLSAKMYPMPWSLGWMKR